MSGSSGITQITLSATSSTELYNIIENFTLANESNHSLLMPVVQRAYNPSQPYINLIPSAMTWPSSGGYQTIQVQTNENWVWEMDEWLSPSVNGGMSGNTIIPIMAAENTGNTRTGVISAVCLSDSSITASTSVEQAGSYVKPYIELGYYLYMATPESASTAVTVSSNIEWYTMTDSRWITLNTVSGSGNGSVSFTIDENTAEFNREGTITVFNYDEDIYVELVIRQASSVKPFIVLSPESFIVEPTGSTGNLISVSANCDYDIEADVDWITVNSASGSGYGSVSFSTAPSDRFVSNVGNIVFSNSAVSAYVRVERKSVERYLSANTTTLNFDSENPETVEVSVYSNTSWQVSIDEGTERGWLSVTPVSGNGNGVIRVSATNGDLRSGTIILYNSEYGLSWTINAEQRDNDAIYYTTTGGDITYVAYYPYGRYFVEDETVYGGGYYVECYVSSNTYSNGVGKIKFDGPVTEIVNNSNYSAPLNGMFACHDDLETIIFPDSITGTFLNTIAGCHNLKSVVYGKNLISYMTGYTLHNGMAILFRECYSLESFNIPTGVTCLWDKCFEKCNSLTAVTIPEQINFVRGSLFLDNTGVTEVNLAEATGITIVPVSMFEGTSSLEKVSFPSSITTMQDRVFMSCPCNEIYMYATTAPSIMETEYNGQHLITQYGTFYGLNADNGVFHYPHGADYSEFIYLFYNSMGNPHLSSWTFIDDL